MLAPDELSCFFIKLDNILISAAAEISGAYASVTIIYCDGCIAFNKINSGIANTYGWIGNDGVIAVIPSELPCIVVFAK